MSIPFPVVAVIGGGASGIAAALAAAQVPGRRVLLLERQQRIGRKLLATGNGRCNLSNWNALPGAYFGTDASFAAPALKAFPPMEVHRFFSGLGLLTVTEDSGRIYPLSDSSNSVLDVLRFALERAGVELRCSFPVEGIRRSGSGFLLTGGPESLTADAVILACGGAAGAKLGGTSDGCIPPSHGSGPIRNTRVPSRASVSRPSCVLRSGVKRWPPVQVKSSLPRPAFPVRPVLTFRVRRPVAERE